MREIRKLYNCTLLLILILLLSACQTVDSQNPTITITSSPLQTNTPQPTSTEEPIQRIIPTATPTTEALQPAPTSIPTSEPIPERLLDPAGPWLLLTPNDSPWTLYNLDGTGQTEIELPEELLVTDGWGEFTHTSHSGRFLSTIVVFPKDPQLWIFELPNEKPILQLSLVGEEARTEIENFEPFDFEGHISVYTPPVLSAIGDAAWSPNGRYLAFTGASNGPSSDLYIYDTERSKLTQLTSGPNQARIMGWSPDSRTIVHYSAEWQVDYMELVENLWTVDIHGNVKNLMVLDKLMIPPEIADWINNRTLLMYYPIFEFGNENLTILDIGTGETEIIEAPSFNEKIFYDPAGNRLLISYGMQWGSDSNIGVYRYELGTKELNTLVEGTHIIGLVEDTPYYISTDGNLLTSSGEVISTLPHKAFEYQLPITSPDGIWIIIYTWATDSGGVISYLMNAEGEIVHEWDSVCNNPRSTPVWLNDSSGFYCYPADQVLLITEENDWEPVLVNTMPAGAIEIIRP